MPHYILLCNLNSDRILNQIVGPTDLNGIKYKVYKEFSIMKQLVTLYFY